jgi:hypothetical protein
MMTATKTTLQYAMESCSRCGGSGSYSYCQMHGSVCFKCSGRKRVLTRAGAKAAAAVAAFMAANFSVPVESLTPGMRVKVDGVTRTIATVTTSGAGKYGVGTDADGNMVWEDYVTVTFTKPVRSAMGPCNSYGYCKGTMVQKAVGGADWDAVVAFARTIKGKGVTVVTTEVAAPAAT